MATLRSFPMVAILVVCAYLFVVRDIRMPRLPIHITAVSR
jgi:hypothetical protein